MLSEAILTQESNEMKEGAQDIILLNLGSSPKCNNCTDEENYVNCIMKHVLTDHELFVYSDEISIESERFLSKL